MFDRKSFASVIKEYAFVKAASVGLVSLRPTEIESKKFDKFWDVFESAVAEVYECEQAEVWDRLLCGTAAKPSKASRWMSIASIIMALIAIALSMTSLR